MSDKYSEVFTYPCLPDCSQGYLVQTYLAVLGQIRKSGAYSTPKAGETKGCMHKRHFFVNQPNRTSILKQWRQIRTLIMILIHRQSLLWNRSIPPPYVLDWPFRRRTDLSTFLKRYPAGILICTVSRPAC